MSRCFYDCGRLGFTGDFYNQSLARTSPPCCGRYTGSLLTSINTNHYYDFLANRGAIRGVIVEPASRRLEPVEVFRGVPYAAPPARLAAPAPPPRWPGTRLADAFAPVCPQALPDISNKTAALARMPLGVYNELRLTLPLLANQSEDCLYLNIYVPGSGFLTSGSPLDPAHRAGGAALLDLAAALRWLRRNVAAFGGDPARVTMAGHSQAAAIANTLLMMPDSKGLVSRVLLLSGSALGAAALAPDAALARRHAAQALRCSQDEATEEHWLIACVRSRPLSALLAVEAPRARFLAGWAPSVPVARGAPPTGQAPTRALHASDAFLDCALAVVVTTTESYQYFNEDDIRHGFEEEHRNRILRTYVRNVYRYHRNEIFAAVRNEYTDWEKPIQHPINIRDATLEALSDALAAAPALRLAQLHARRGAPTYFAHFVHQSKEVDYPQRLGSVTSETLPYFLGLPLVGGAPLAPRNYSRGDVGVAEAAVALLASFAKTGEPRAGDHHESGVAWPRYELNTQQYLSISSKLRVKSHYRGHKMALWLHLVPQLHRPGAAPRHHQFRATHPDMFADLEHLLRWMLHKDPSSRCTVPQLTSHAWLTQPAPPGKHLFHELLVCDRHEANPEMYYSGSLSSPRSGSLISLAEHLAKERSNPSEVAIRSDGKPSRDEPKRNSMALHALSTADKDAQSDNYSLRSSADSFTIEYKGVTKDYRGHDATCQCYVYTEYTSVDLFM
uniref:Carboxyl/cholinesterase-030b n=1 Tax=Plutella xylostella TaxID=51655 RepID=A0A1L8D6K2_PLUXY